MRTSLNEIAAIESQLRQDEPGTRLLLEARLLLDPDFRRKVNAQREACLLVRAYGRQQLRSEIAAVHEELFTSAAHRSFREKILRIFFR